MKALFRRLVPISIGLALLAAIVYAFLPQPVRVDLASASRGPLQVAVEEDGKTRIKNRYVVSSPLSGRLLRIELQPGDSVEAGRTTVAVIEPSDPALLDPRARAEADARVKAADARLHQSGTTMDQTLAAMQFSESELARIRGLRDRGGSAQHEFDEVQMKFRMRSEEYRAARFAQDIAKFELEQAQAALLRTTPRVKRDPSAANGAADGKSLRKPIDPPPVNGATGDGSKEDWFFEIASPINGRVLRKFQESTTVVSAGTQLIQLGNPEDLEVEIDVLSADGVKIKPGDKVLLEQWGGESPLDGRVRLVEPSAFTKISALGVEEQRVNVIVDFENSPEQRGTLGDAFRVEAKIIIWENPDVVRVPIGALFRHDADWAVFRGHDGRARLTIVAIGHRNGVSAEVLDGLKENDQVVLHPSDQVVDGRRILPR